MTKPARRARYLLPVAVALTVMAIPCAVLANTAGPYLNWQSKAQPVAEAPAQTEQVNTPNGAYPVPPSPYGQVGDPYARSLRWPAKQTPAVASVSPPPQPIFAPVPAPPIRNPSPVSVSQPVPVSAPRPVAVVPVPQTPEREDPGLADDPGMAPALSTDGAYQVPTTSKYAARIAAARATSLPTAEAPKAGKTDPKSTATAPEPDVSLASQETDHVFIPGEHYTTAADEPRIYSLHRQYGMRPDPITVTQGAIGALLTVSPEEGGDPNDDDDKKSATDKN